MSVHVTPSIHERLFVFLFTILLNTVSALLVFAIFCVLCAALIVGVRIVLGVI